MYQVSINLNVELKSKGEWITMAKILQKVDTDQEFFGNALHTSGNLDGVKVEAVSTTFRNDKPSVEVVLKIPQLELLVDALKAMDGRVNVLEQKDQNKDEAIANLNYVFHNKVESLQDQLQEAHSVPVMDSDTGDIIPYGDQRTL